MDRRARRRRRQAGERWHRRRRRVRARRLRCRAGPDVPRRPHHRLRLPRRVDRRRPPTRRRSGRRRPDLVRRRRRQELPGHVRSDLLLRLPARHGRPGRHRRATPSTTSPTMAPCCWSSRTRSTGAPPTSPTTRSQRCCTPRRPRSARRTRSPRRSASASAPRPAKLNCGRVRTGRLHTVPPCRRDADQPDPRSQE